MAIVEGAEVDDKMGVTKKDKTQKAIGDAPIYPESGQHNGAGGNTMVMAKAALKGLSRDDQAVICQEQIEQWRAMLLKIGERNSSGTNSSGTMSSGGGRNNSSSQNIVPSEDLQSSVVVTNDEDKFVINPDLVSSFKYNAPSEGV